MAKQKVVIEIDYDFNPNSGTSCTLTWSMLEMLLKKDNQIYPNEYVSGYVISEDGIRFTIVSKE